jgi:O-antigen ligase
MFNRKVSSLAVVLLGLTSSVPLYFHFGGDAGGAPIFYVQCAVISGLLCIYFFRHKKSDLTPLDQFVAAFLVWLLISFLLNVPWMWATGRSELAGRQLTSAVTVLFTMSPYLLGRCYFDMRQQGVIFIRSVTASLAVVILGYAIFYSNHLADLYVARQGINQRIPMMIGFLAWAICAQVFWDFRGRYMLLAVWLGSMLIVALSLTRGAYFQCFVSGVAFIAISIFRNPKNRIRHLWRWAVTGLVGCLLLVGLAARSEPDSSFGGTITVIVNRAGQLLALREQINTDESANGRVEIWTRLMRRLEMSPVQMVIGFGQLGPSAYLGGKFIDMSGVVTNEYNAHNQYLDTLVRSGIVGLLLECALLAAIIVKPFRNASGSIHLQFFKTHSVALIGVLVYGMFHETLRFQMFGLYFWLYAGIVSRELYSQKGSRAPFGDRSYSAWSLLPLKS